MVYVQHIVIRCSSLTSHSNCLFRARDLRDRLFGDSQFNENCLRVSEPINAQQWNSYLPSFGCLCLSPFNLWSNDLSKFLHDEEELLQRISSLPKRYADLLFGIPQKTISSRKSFSYAMTLLLTNASIEFRQDLKKRLFALDDSSTMPPEEIIHIYFSKKPLIYYLPLVLIYIVVFLYIYYSVSKCSSIVVLH